LHRLEKACREGYPRSDFSCWHAHLISTLKYDSFAQIAQGGSPVCFTSIRLDDETSDRLRDRAIRKGVTMEVKVCQIPKQAGSRQGWQHWYSWAIRSRLAPIKEVARMVKRHLEGVLTAVVEGITNARAESVNAKIQWLKYTARGFRNRDRFRNAIYFHLCGLNLYPAGLTPSAVTHTNREAGLRISLRPPWRNLSAAPVTRAHPSVGGNGIGDLPWHAERR
jgi:transposase